MRQVTMVCLVSVFVLVFGFASEKAMAQYTGEFVICQDGTSPDTCRATAVPPDADGVVRWDRSALGNIICAGVGIVPQAGDCDFTGASFLGFDCAGPVINIFQTTVPAGQDMAIACSDTTPLPSGNYSAKATGNTCFGGESVCQNISF